MKRLSVHFGSDANNLQPVPVNQDLHPIPLRNDYFDGRLAVRVKNFIDEQGNTLADTESGFFASVPYLTPLETVDGMGRFLQPEKLDDVVFGNVFDKPIRDQLPYGSTVALKFTSVVDPALKHDLWADEPWAWSPLVSTMNRLSVERLETEELPSWKSVGEEDVTQLYDDGSRPTNLPSDIEGRRKYFAIEANRQGLEVGPKDALTFSFENGFIDFTTFSLNLPVGRFQVPLARLYDANAQPIRYICRSPEHVFFIIQFDLVDDLVNDKGSK